MCNVRFTRSTDNHTTARPRSWRANPKRIENRIERQQQLTKKGRRERERKEVHTTSTISSQRKRTLSQHCSVLTFRPGNRHTQRVIFLYAYSPSYALCVSLYTNRAGWRRAIYGAKTTRSACAALSIEAVYWSSRRRRSSSHRATNSLMSSPCRAVVGRIRNGPVVFSLWTSLRHHLGRPFS